VSDERGMKAPTLFTTMYMHAAPQDAVPASMRRTEAIETRHRLPCSRSSACTWVAESTPSSTSTPLSGRSAGDAHEYRAQELRSRGREHKHGVVWQARLHERALNFVSV